jgi:hypothetical protein
LVTNRLPERWQRNFSHLASAALMPKDYLSLSLASLCFQLEDLLHLICLYYTIYKPHSFTENVCTEIRASAFYGACASAPELVSSLTFLSWAAEFYLFSLWRGQRARHFAIALFFSALHVCEIPQLGRLIFISFAVIPARDLFSELHKERDQGR